VVILFSREVPDGETAISAMPAHLAEPVIPATGGVRHIAWGAVVLLAVMLLGGALMRAVFGPLQEAAKLDLGLSDFQISLVQGLATGLPILLFSLPVAWVIDHGHRVRLLICLLAICIIGTFWTGFASGFDTLFMARMLSSLGATCAISVTISLAADLCAAEKRGRALIALSIGVYVGSAAAFALGGALLGAFSAHSITLFGPMAPWRATHLVIGILGAFIVLPLLAMKEPPRREVEQTSHALRPALTALWGRRRFLIPLFVGQLGVSMADAAAFIWATPVLIRHFHQQPAQFANWVGAVILLSGLVGSALGGISADWGQKTRKRGFILIGAVIATIVGVPAALYPVMPTVGLFGVLFGVLLLSGTIISLVASTAVAVLIPNEERGVCMSAFGIVNSIVGLTLAPTLVTLGSTALGGEQHLGEALAITGVITGLLSVAGYVFAMINAPDPAADVLDKGIKAPA
jgi:MFS family permease